VRSHPGGGLLDGQLSGDDSVAGIESTLVAQLGAVLNLDDGDDAGQP